MNRTKVRAAAFGTLIVVAVAVFVVWQRDANTRLRQELSHVREANKELARLSEENERLAKQNQRSGTPKSEPDEWDRLRQDHEELLRLCGQVGVLRSQLAEAQQQAATNQNRRVPASDPSAVAAREANVQANARRWYLGDWAQAFHDFAFENNGQFPTHFAQAQAHYEKAQKRERPGQVGVSPRTSAYFKSLTPDEFEIVFQGSLSMLTNPANSIVLRERQPRRLPDGRWARIYGFADGSTIQHIEPDGNFAAWEQAPKQRERVSPGARRYSFYGQR